MSLRLNIRTVTQDDLPWLLKLYQQLHLEDPQIPLEAAVQIWQQSMAYKGTEIFIGLIENELVATCSLVVIPNLTRGGLSYALIENVVTDALHRKKGYGHAVIRTAIAHAWEVNCYKVMLLTGSNDPDTLRFYHQAGFEQNKTGFQIRRPEICPEHLTTVK
ncbi:GNAT family N-acetyltransferase [Phyllobacterium sp. TAF24]|uniref:GNAT family N-acetyltransferase n=1 Tax=Phyllobacterium sp. TAF24 TaxID=3233068 RepID=UPI003F96554E